MLRQFIDSLAGIIYPKRCLSCKNKIETASIDGLICLECWKEIKVNLPPFCQRCGRNLEKKSFTKHLCPECVRGNLHFDRAFSPCRYEGIIKELVYEFKYKGKDYLGLPLSKLMIKFIEEYSLPIDQLDLIIPIPLHKTRLREREFNQAQILGAHIAQRFAKEISHDNLVRLRHTKAQAELTKDERLMNVQKSFSVVKAEQLINKNILLVDDVLTTGATCSEAAYTLKKSGAKIVFVLTLAN